MGRVGKERTQSNGKQCVGYKWKSLQILMMGIEFRAFWSPLLFQNFPANLFHQQYRHQTTVRVMHQVCSRCYRQEVPSTNIPGILISQVIWALRKNPESLGKAHPQRSCALPGISYWQGWSYDSNCLGPWPEGNLWCREGRGMQGKLVEMGCRNGVQWERKVVSFLAHVFAMLLNVFGY